MKAKVEFVYPAIRVSLESENSMEDSVLRAFAECGLWVESWDIALEPHKGPSHMMLAPHKPNDVEVRE